MLTKEQTAAVADTDEDLIKEARDLARMGRGARTHDQKRRLALIHCTLEDRHPSIGPVLDRWAASMAPMGTYTETLIGALPRSTPSA